MVEVSILEQIQQLQFTDRPAAEQMLRQFIEEVFAYSVEKVELRPLAVSLNSFNGFVTLADGRRLFFKSHVEPGSVIAEYYNSDLLQQAGYPIIRPVAAATEPGKQMLLYEVVEDQSVFDVAWELERGHSDQIDLLRLTTAQASADDALLKAYLDTLQWKEAADHAAAPVHQLFSHRLTGGRLDEFYGEGVEVTLPGAGKVSLAQIRKARWRINGVEYVDTLDDLIDRAIRLLQPGQAGPAVVGHGDAHNGNVFMRGDELVYFDPAFAGVHDALLDLV
ncbi:MAG: phosphotransferase, partial [Anaerolineae bacterium]|nr:phosphotransferase [Anaerolineae bacterium]